MQKAGAEQREGSAGVGEQVAPAGKKAEGLSPAPPSKKAVISGQMMWLEVTCAHTFYTET